MLVAYLHLCSMPSVIKAEVRDKESSSFCVSEATKQAECCNLNPKRHMQAFMGDVAMWTGIVTGSMMFVSPWIFSRLGWKGVAKATPNFLCWTGVPFFVACIALALLNPASILPLRILVAVGALLQVGSGLPASSS